MSRVVMLLVGINAALGIASYLAAKSVLKRTRNLILHDEEEEGSKEWPHEPTSPSDRTTGRSGNS